MRRLTEEAEFSAEETDLADERDVSDVFGQRKLQKAAFFYFLRIFGDFLFPPVCPGCGKPVSEHGLFCPACFKTVRLLTSPYCCRCGRPFLSLRTPEAAREALCDKCSLSPPDFDTARAAFIYQGKVRDLILQMKYQHHPEQAQFFAPYLVQAGRELLREAEILCAVPLAVARLRQRGFNQAGLLAKEVAKRTDKAFLPDILLRIRATAPLYGKTIEERHAETKQAVKINPQREKAVQGKTVLLVDDILTTGATANICAQVLKKAGAERVYVLCVACVLDFREA